ncbi:MAG: glycosyltransferase family 2 protein [Thermodesulfobacteriota bacterium]
MIDLSIVIVNWNTRKLLLDCLASVHATVQGIDFEVLVVDNASHDGSVEAVRQAYPGVLVIQNQENLGFAKANNQALREMRGRYALLLNTDAVLTEGAVAGLIAFMEATPRAGLACGQLLNADGSKQNSVANFPSLLSLLCNETLLRLLLPRRFPSKHQEYKEPIAVDSCIGACLMARRAAMEEVGLLDERYFFFMEETDWALAMARAGWQSWLVPGCRVYHLQGQSAGHNLRSRIMFYRSRYQYIRKWHPVQFPAWFGVIVLRLSINVLLNLAGTLLTLGMVRECRGRLNLYVQLLAWHLRGCP